MINLAQRGSRSAAEVVIAILLGPAVKPPNAWVLLTMRPGEAPLEALTAAIIRLWQLAILAIIALISDGSVTPDQRIQVFQQSGVYP
jgi:hypothetical protein